MKVESRLSSAERVTLFDPSSRRDGFGHRFGAGEQANSHLPLLGRVELRERPQLRGIFQNRVTVLAEVLDDVRRRAPGRGTGRCEQCGP
jgi:hypothetical protein